jgi:phosphotransferase family enzyme
VTTLADERLDEELLRQALARPFGCAAYRIAVVRRERLKTGIYRLQLEVAGVERSVIAKRLAPEIAVRNRRVVESWLPGEGLEALAAPLLATLAAPTYTWLVQEDLGTRTLAVGAPDPARIGAAVERIACLHRRFAEHAVLGECRLLGGDLGMPFHAGNLRDARRALATLRARLAPAGGERLELCERLLERLRLLQSDAQRRTQAMERWGGPETLLHGDLWPSNLIEVPRGNGFELRLIDWDHAAAGPPVYDVSTFLYRIAPAERRGVWAAYRHAYGSGPWEFPAEPELALLCETAEHARLANLLIWPALAALRGGEWAYADLADVEGWFQDLAPLFPRGF